MPSNYLYLVSLAHVVGKVAFSISTFFGLVLIFLTLFGVRKIFGAYKYLMVIFTSLGIFLAGLEMIFHPNLHFYNSGFVFFTLSTPFNLTKEVLTKMLGRSILFCEHNSEIPFFAGHGILLDMDSITEIYFKDEMFLRYNVILNDIPRMTFLAYDPKNGCIRWSDTTYTITITSIMSSQYLTMMYCGWNMYSKMEEKIANFSAALKRHNRQLFKTLVLQITAPTIFLFSPLVFIMYLPFFEIEMSFPAGATFCAFSFYPAMDSIIVLLVVTEYRFVAKKLWKSFLLNTSNVRRPKDSYNTSTTGPISLATIRSAT